MRRVLALAAMVLLAACGDSTGPDGLRGTYELRAVDGTPLPAVIGTDLSGDPVALLSGTAVFRRDGSYDLEIRKHALGGEGTIPYRGTYTAGAGEAVLADAMTGNTYPATYTRDGFTLRFRGGAHEWRRR